MLGWLYDYLASADGAEAQANRKLVALFARSQFHLSNGLFMTDRSLKALSDRGGRAVVRLQKKVAV